MRQLSPQQLARRRRDPCTFIEQNLYDPETGKPFKLLPAERDFIKHAFKTDDIGRLLYQDQAYCAPKKSGKTGFGVLHLLTTTLFLVAASPKGIAARSHAD